MPSSLRLPLALLGLLLTAAPAAARDTSSADGLSSAERARRDALLDAYARLVDPSLGELAPAEHAHGPQCLTGLVKELRENQHLFSPEQWLDIQSTLGLPAPSATPPSPLADGTCTGDTAEYSLVGEHFVVYWGSGSTEQQAADLLESLEFSWDTLIDDLGWDPPTGTPELKLRFQISDANYAGAYTTIDWCSGVGYVPYMVAGRGSFSAGTWYKTMAAHEFNHASQWGYSYAHEFYWWEATATWVEEHVYPSYNDWADMYVYFSFYPHIALNASSQQDQEIFGHMYAMGIFATWLDENVGGHDFVLGTWDEVKGDNGQYDAWLPDVLEDMGEDFDSLWQGFMASTAFMDFAEPSYYYDIQSVDDVGSLPYDGDEQRDAPQSLGMNYFEIDEDEGAEGKFLQVDFAGDDGIEWNVVLVTGEGGTVHEYVAAEIEDGAGSAWIPFDGDKKAFLVVSPKDEDVQGYFYDWTDADEYDFDFSLCLADSDSADSETGVPCGQDVDGGTDSGDGPSTPGADEDEDGSGGCGCFAGATPAAGLLWAAGLLGLASRRRRDPRAG